MQYNYHFRKFAKQKHVKFTLLWIVTTTNIPDQQVLRTHTIIFSVFVYKDTHTTTAIPLLGVNTMLMRSYPLAILFAKPEGNQKETGVGL